MSGQAYASEAERDEARRRPQRPEAAEAAPAPAPAPAEAIDPVSLLQLQRSAGNAAVSAMLARTAELGTGNGEVRGEVVVDVDARRDGPAIAGNGAAGRLLQRKPVDIAKTHSVTFDQDGPTGVTKAPRAGGQKPSMVVNAQVKDGWVLPDGTKLKGGHLFKAEYGGPDDQTNVVPWTEACEAQFGTYEDEYADAAQKQARADKTPVTITLGKAAAFADRPDLQATDQELDAAGWGATDPDRKVRQDKYAEVAENFSNIPTKVSVTISGLKTNPAPFERNGVQVAPDFKKNDAALKPGFAPYVRFTMNPGLPRTLGKISDWPAMKKKDKPGVDGERYAKLAHVKGRHGDQFGGDKKTGYDALVAFEDQLEKFVANPKNTQIEGTYQGVEVIHYFDDATQLFVCVTPANELWAGFKLSVAQAASLKSKGMVK